MLLHVSLRLIMVILKATEYLSEFPSGLTLLPDPEVGRVWKEVDLGEGHAFLTFPLSKIGSPQGFDVPLLTVPTDTFMYTCCAFSLSHTFIFNQDISDLVMKLQNDHML